MIYFKDGDKATDLYDLFKIAYNGNKRTLFPITYSDAALTKKQCHKARRSFGDLVEISKTYFPDVTPGEVASLLIELDLCCFVCSDIEKLVFVNYHDTKGCCADSIDDYGVNDGYSYKDIINLSNKYKNKKK